MARARTWTACAARTTGGSTPCPAFTPGDMRPRIVTVLFIVKYIMSLKDPPHRGLKCPQRGSVLQNLMDHFWASEARQPAVPGVFELFVCLFYSMFGICLSVTYLPQIDKRCPKVYLFNQSFPVISLLHVPLLTHVSWL